MSEESYRANLDDILIERLKEERDAARREVLRLKSIIARRLACDGSDGRWHAGENFALTEEMRNVIAPI